MLVVVTDARVLKHKGSDSMLKNEKNEKKKKKKKKKGKKKERKKIAYYK